MKQLFNFKNGAIPLSLVIALIVSVVNFIQPSPVCANGNCDIGYIEKDESNPFDYNGTEIINRVIVKAGSDQSSDTPCTIFTQDGNNGCYAVSGLDTTHVTVTRIGDGLICKGISHVEFYHDVVTPTPSPTPMLTPSPEPTLNPTPIPTPEEKVLSATATPNPDSGKHSKLSMDNVSCSEMKVKATYTAQENGSGDQDVEITFRYGGEEKKVKTDQNGEAKVEFGFKGEGTLEAIGSQDYSDQSLHVNAMNCPVNNQEQVLGDSFGSGQVLGTSTTQLAQTGGFDQIFGLLVRMVSGFIFTAGSFLKLRRVKA